MTLSKAFDYFTATDADMSLRAEQFDELFEDVSEETRAGMMATLSHLLKFKVPENYAKAALMEAWKLLFSDLQTQRQALVQGTWVRNRIGG